MSEFRIEKVRHALEITLATDEQLAGTVFLEPVARHHTGPQDPRELLNDEESFFPVAVDGGLILVAKDQVKLVRYTTALKLPDLSPPTIDVRVTLADGRTVDGGIEVEARSDAHRLLDYLNHFQGRFLSMITANRAHCLVNRRLIVGVQQR